MTSPSQRKAILSGLFWKMMERGGSQGAQFLVQIALARLLLPADYGVLAIVTVFTVLAGVFVQSGFHSALIQRRDVEDLDYSSVFWFSLAVAGILYIILYFSAPAIAAFNRDPLISPVLRGLALILFFGALRSVHTARVTRRMQFKKLFYSTVSATIISGVVGVTLAYLGLGVWALVVQQLVSGVVMTAVLWRMEPWRPRWMFSWTRLGGILSYSWKLLASSLINNLYTDLRILVIGRMYPLAILGYYNRGRQFPQLIAGNIDQSIQTVMFPALSQLQDDRSRMRALVRRSIVTSSFLIFPLMMGLAVVAEPLVVLLITDRWLPSVPFLRIFCGIYALQPIHAANLQAINAMGRSDIFLKLEVVKKSIGLGILAFSLQFGVYGIALGGLASGILFTLINAYPNRTLLDYPYLDQIRDILPSLLLSLIMGAAVWALTLLPLGVVPLLVLQIVAGSILYFGMAALFRLECFSYAVQLIRNRGREPQAAPPAEREAE